MRSARKIKLEDVVGRDVEVFVLGDSPIADSWPLARAFLHEGDLWVECISASGQQHKFRAPISAILICDDRNPPAPRYGIVVRLDTEAGRYIKRLIDEQNRQDHKEP